MSMFMYPAEVTPDDNGTAMVTFPDIPEAVTFGDDKDDALARAVDALETALQGYILDRREIPVPTVARRKPKVSPSLLGQLKLSVYTAMQERHWKKADLSRAMNLNPRQIDRLLDLRHNSTVPQLSQALAVCGKTADVEIRKLAA